MNLKDYFLPYQKRWILDESPMKLYAKSRRIGITYATSYRANDKCLRRPNHVQWVSSRDERTAREFITDYVAKWASAANAVCAGLNGERMRVVDMEKGIRAFAAEYGNGSRIVSLSSTPEAFAGKGGDVLIDEADLHADGGRVIDMALPCTTWGGQLEVVSALRADGHANTPFCRMVREASEGGNPMGWSFHRTSILDAAAEGFVERVNAVSGGNATREEWLRRMRARCRTEEAWKTQYLIEPGSDGSAFLSYDLIAGCETERIEADPDSRNPRYAGFDVGRKKDLGVYFELERSGDVLRQSELRTFERASFRAQSEFLAQRLKDARLMRLCVDATGLGMMLAEELQNRYGRWRVEGISFSAPAKAAMATALRAAFEDRRLRILPDADVREDLHKVRKTVTAAGNVRYEADRDEAGHSDRFWALALAVHAAGGEEDGSGIAMEAAGPDAPHEREIRSEWEFWR